MAKRRRKKKQDDPIVALVMLFMIGAFFGSIKLTNSISGGLVGSGIVFAIFVIIAFMLKRQREERLKLSGIADIDKMDGRQFELYLGHLFKAHGYAAEVTQASGDYGADLVVRKDGRKIIVQAKRYSKAVGLSAVQEAYTAIRHYNAHEAWVVSNRGYTEPARALARSNGVKLIDREQLIDMALKLNPGVAQAPTVIAAASPASKEECKKCGAPMVRRKGPKGLFYGCSTYPKCRSIAQYEYSV
ncbi:restriction endonuclease [Paenibacillus herberti]|uniref:Restriction endonuclease n=1 Tax=Paenibacillus herberti TaxID=1619309 RepID=A0A229P0L4_9BACL|nr:restriction endonuclease [Paenibacillus herberti]OXM15455.1 hypothetical protein CGZ75_01570 [Paenibacillus herberti]